MTRLALPCAALVTLGVVLGATAQTPKVVSDGYGDYVHVPAGSFRMGDSFGDGESRERPVHTVELDAFYIAKFEMTNGEWKKFRDEQFLWFRVAEATYDNYSFNSKIGQPAAPKPGAKTA